MDELLLQLERHIQKLIDQFDQLNRSHQQLHQSTSVLTREKESLLTKQKRAIVQIEALISKLKSMGKIS